MSVKNNNENTEELKKKNSFEEDEFEIDNDTDNDLEDDELEVENDLGDIDFEKLDLDEIGMEEAQSDYDDYDDDEFEEFGDDKGLKKKFKRKPVSKFIFLGVLLCIANLIIAGIVANNVKKLVPTNYMVIFVVVIALVNVLLVFASRRIWSGIIMAIISIALSAGMLYGLDVLTSVEEAIEGITLEKEEEPQIITEMGIVVLNDSNIHQISDLSEFAIGFINDADYSYTKELMNEIDKAIGGTANYVEFSTTANMAEALYMKTVDAFIINKAYIDMVAELEGYEDFLTRTKVVYSSEIVKYIEVVERREPNLEAFVVYISGMDRFGHIGVRTRSDVNIIAVVNTRTRHIQLINTPRDYYVPHLASNGALDKLTHAALYGVDSSIYALEKLYGIQIDFYVKMNFSGFEGVIDALGGIDVYSEYDFTVEPIKHYTVGMNHLNGLEALAFARERKSFAAGDVQRGKHQMEVIKATVNKMTSPDMLSKYSTVLEELSWCFETNMTSDDIYTLVRGQLTSTKAWTFDSYTTTGTGAMAETFSMPGTELYVTHPNMDNVKYAKELIEAALAEE